MGVLVDPCNAGTHAGGQNGNTGRNPFLKKKNATKGKGSEGAHNWRNNAKLFTRPRRSRQRIRG